MANPNQSKDPRTGRFTANPANSGFSFSNVFSAWLSGTASRVTSWLTSLLASLTSGLLNLLRTLFTNIFHGLFSVVRTVFTGGLAALSAALALSVGGLIAGLKSATDAMKDFARNALSIRAGTGLSYGAAGNLLSRGLAFGMSPPETAGAFGNQNPLIASMRGNNYQSGNYFSSLSREFNAMSSNGPLGNIMANAMLKSRFGGNVPDSVRNIAAMNPDKVAAQEKWGSGIQSRLGVNGSQIQQYAEDVFLAGNKVATVFQLLKLRFGAIVGPQLVAGLERVADFLGRNADRIKSVLERVGSAVSNILLHGLEVVLNFLDQNAGKLEEWFWRAFTFLLRDVPVGFMRAGAAIGRALALVLDAFAYGVNWLTERAPIISDFFNHLTAGFLNALPEIQRAGNDLINIIGGIANGIRNIIGQLRGITGHEGGSGGGNNSGSNNSQGQAAGGARAVGFLARGLQWLGATGRGIGNAIGLTTGDPNSGGLINELFNGYVGWRIASRLAPPAVQLGGRLVGSGVQALLTRIAASGGVGAITTGAGGALGNLWGGISGAASSASGALSATGYGIMNNLAVAGAGAAPIALTTIAGLGLGVGAGAGLYKLRQHAGLANPDQPFWDAMGTGWGRARDYITRNPGHYDRMLERAEIEFNNRSKGVRSRRPGAASPAGARNPVTPEDIANSAQATLDQVGANSLAGYSTRGLVGLNNIAQRGLTALQQNGPGIAGSAANGASWLREQAANLESGANGYRSKFDELISVTQRVENRIKEGNDAQKENNQQFGLMIDVLGRSLAYAGLDAALAKVR